MTCLVHQNQFVDTQTVAAEHSPHHVVHMGAFFKQLATDRAFSILLFEHPLFPLCPSSPCKSLDKILCSKYVSQLGSKGFASSLILAWRTILVLMYFV